MSDYWKSCAPAYIFFGFLLSVFSVVIVIGGVKTGNAVMASIGGGSFALGIAVIVLVGKLMR